MATKVIIQLMIRPFRFFKHEEKNVFNDALVYGQFRKYFGYITNHRVKGPQAIALYVSVHLEGKYAPLAVLYHGHEVQIWQK